MALSGVRLETNRGKKLDGILRPGPSLWHGKIRPARAGANAGRTARRHIVFSFIVMCSTQWGAASASLAVRFWMIGR